MNPGIARLAIVLALVIGGVAVLANGFTDEGAAAAPPDEPATTSPTQSPSPSRSPEASIVPNQEGVLVQVLNGTSRAGYAATFQEMLVDVGGYLEAGDPGDAPDKPIVDSIVYFRADDNAKQNQADAELLSDEYLGGAPVERLPADLADSDVIDPAADVVVVLGEDQAGTP